MCRHVSSCDGEQGELDQPFLGGEGEAGQGSTQSDLGADGECLEFECLTSDCEFVRVISRGGGSNRK